MKNRTDGVAQPKLESPKKYRNRKQRNRSNRRTEFSSFVVGLDGHCMNPFSHECIPTALDPAHIEPKRPHSPKLDDPCNGITLCRFSHNLFDLGGKDEHGVWQSALWWKLRILDVWVGDPCYRWHDVHEELKRKFR